jgi:hypothetical protein
MTDLKDLLGLALDDDPVGAYSGTMPVQDDLARGQRLLRRRTRNRMMAGGAAVAIVAVAAIVPTVASGSGASGTKATAGSSPVQAVVSNPVVSGSGPAHAGTKPATARIELVVYTGTQPAGYTVKMIPDHWVIQGSTPWALTIAPANASDKDPNVFIGKLVILQESFDTSHTQGLTKTDVKGHVAYYRVQDGIASLIIEQTPGRWLDVQAPTSLGWTEQQEAQFGAGVTILPTAQEGKG